MTMLRGRPPAGHRASRRPSGGSARASGGSVKAPSRSPRSPGRSAASNARPAVAPAVALTALLQGVALCTGGAGAALAAAEPLRLVSGDDFGKFSGEALEAGGMATQIVREALAAAGTDLELSFDGWEAGYAAAAAGDLDGAFPWYHLPEREAAFVYTDSVYELVERIFQLDGDPDVPEIPGAANLAGLNLCYPAGWGAPASIQALIDGGTLERTSPGNMSRCFDLLANEQVDVVLAPQLQGYETVEAHPALDAFDVATASWEVTVRTLSVLVPKALGRERACGIVARFDAGLATLRANGYFDAVVRRWFGPLAQLAAPDERVALVRRTADGDESIEGRAIGLSGGRFLVDAGDAGLLDVPLEEVRWVGRADAVELAGSRAWCLGTDAAPEPVPVDRRELAVAALAASEAELVVADRPPTPGERDALAPLDEFPSEATEHVFALEAIEPVVNASRDVPAIALDGLRRAVGGEAPGWSELGARDGNGAPTVHVEDAVADALSSSGSSLGGLPPPGPGVRRHATREDVLAAVAADPDALGLVMLHDDASGDLGAGVRAAAVVDCGLVHASGGFAVRTEEYPLARRLYMYYSPVREGGFAGAFVRHAQSDAGQRTIAEHGLVGLSIEPGPPGTRGDMLANLARTGVQDEAVGTGLVASLDGAMRLSTTFRFGTASSHLDVRAVRDAERLAAWLRDEGLDGDDVALVGYADARGTYARNCRLSDERVAGVARALASEGVEGTPLAFAACEEAPVACNATAAGRELNRRVEVWRRGGTGR